MSEDNAAKGSIKMFLPENEAWAYRVGRKHGARPPWQPIETAPKDGTEVLFWSDRDGLCLGAWREMRYPIWERVDEETQKLKRYDDFSNWGGTAASGTCLNPTTLTHWMPLPEGPGG